MFVCVCVCLCVICFLLFCFGATARFGQYDSISSCSRKNARCSDCDCVRYLRLERERIAGYMGENDEEKVTRLLLLLLEKTKFPLFPSSHPWLWFCLFLFLSSFFFPSFFYVVRSTELEGDPQRVAQALQEFDILLTTGISSSSSNNHNSRYVLV